MCSYCASCPCICRAQKIHTRQKVTVNDKKRPKTMEGFQEMFDKIYPASNRTLDQAGIHLVEEMGEIAEAVLNYRGNHNDKDFKNIVLESADLISCIMGVFNSLQTNLAKELSITFNENCHVCKKAPCICNFIDIIGFKS
jgi:NTP pyrophosphatase (non-canonical NTP hydrolase)